jgi:micrococcal nuclease
MGTQVARRPGPCLALPMAIVLFLFSMLMAAPCQAWQGKAIHIADGDTITVLTRDSRQVKIRLYGIDTPERGQDFGGKAKEFTADLVGNRLVEIDPIAQDRYGRIVALVKVDGRSVNEELLEAGLAWVYRRYCDAPFCSEWLKLEDQARHRRLGLWTLAEPITPWDYRDGGKKRTHHADGTAGAYLGNVTSRVFHAPTCRYYRCTSCVQPFRTREEALAAGYASCGVCRP